MPFESGGFGYGDVDVSSSQLFAFENFSGFGFKVLQICPPLVSYPYAISKL